MPAISTLVGAILISPSRNCVASRRFWTGMTLRPATTAASGALSAGTSTPVLPSALAGPHGTGQRELADDDKIMGLVGLDLFAGGEHADGDGEIEARAFFFH